jgi:hypothetical protein
MQKWRQILAAVLLLFGSPTLAQLAEVPKQQPEFRRHPIELKGLSCDGGQFGTSMPSSVAAYRALGKLVREASGPATDYSGQPGTHNWYRFEYPGLSVHAVIALKKPHKSFIESASLSRAQWNDLVGIKIGTRIDDLLSHAKVGRIRVKSPLFLCGALEGAPDCATVDFVKGVISKVEYECYTG